MLKTTTSAPDPPKVDWFPDGTTDQEFELFGDQCLVFFLGGVPGASTILGPASGQPIALFGFSKVPSDPVGNLLDASAAGLSQRDGFYKFPVKRLEWKNANSLGGTTQVQMPVMVELESDVNNLRPVFYFSAYDGHGYRPNDGGPNQGGIAGESVTTVPLPVAWKPAGAAATVTSQGPNPYTLLDPNGKVVYMKHETFQLIIPGDDALFGTGGRVAAGQTLSMPPAPWIT